MEREKYSDLILLSNKAHNFLDILRKINLAMGDYAFTPREKDNMFGDIATALYELRKAVIEEVPLEDSYKPVCFVCGSDMVKCIEDEDNGLWYIRCNECEVRTLDAYEQENAWAMWRRLEEIHSSRVI